MSSISARLALAAALLTAPVLADDPKDPAMRSAAARARDREQIRQLNLAQLAHVRQRDAGYAAGWAAARSPRAESADDRAYAVARDDYERRLADWREKVRACRAGDWDACR